MPRIAMTEGADRDGTLVRGVSAPVDKAKLLHAKLASMTAHQIAAGIQAGEFGSPSDSNWRIRAAHDALYLASDRESASREERATAAAEAAAARASRAERWAMYATIIATMTLAIPHISSIVSMLT